MKATETHLKDCFTLEPTVFKDNRGYFFESYNQKKFEELTGLNVTFIQDNQASSTFGVVRGLHIQRPPFCQAKLLRVLQGKIIDVAVDLRKDSSTYGKSVAVELSDENHKQLFIPRGFVHGYSVLSETALIAYKCDNLYNRESEDAVFPFDETLNIDWGVSLSEAVLSEKDQNAKSFKDFVPVEL
ncbi:MAG: dTDP-4-dehydrorhamnose 3,5-epimerase [Flavobacteriaceae bacterium]|nr:MAG: dTDP-4-dehydrorhamnose 3,5-epimerase [Flavobacteriaceae bacterium]